MADDPCILQQTFDIGLGVLGNGINIEVGKRRSEVFSFAQNRDPRKARLESF